MSDRSGEATDTYLPGAPFGNGATLGLGGLPHLDADAAAAFAVQEFDIATVPSLPRRSPADIPIARAVAGWQGVSPDGVDGVRVDRAAFGEPAAIDLDDEAFAGLRAFLDLARSRPLDGPIAWQLTGPVTLGVMLRRAGLDADVAFTMAGRAIRTRLADISAAVAAAGPSSPQLVLLDEPCLDQLMAPDFPLPPDEAVDLMSGAMAALPPATIAGIHCGAPADLATMLAAGPGVISVPVDEALVEWAGYISRFVDDGGIVAWGAIPTDGPVGTSAERHWRVLSDLWCTLVQRGCDPVALRRHGLITPTDGLGAHSLAVAHRIARLTGDVGKRVRDQAGATRFALGA